MDETNSANSASVAAFIDEFDPAGQSKAAAIVKEIQGFEVWRDKESVEQKLSADASTRPEGFAVNDLKRFSGLLEQLSKLKMSAAAGKRSAPVLPSNTSDIKEYMTFDQVFEVVQKRGNSFPEGYYVSFGNYPIRDLAVAELEAQSEAFIASKGGESAAKKLSGAADQVRSLYQSLGREPDASVAKKLALVDSLAAAARSELRTGVPVAAPTVVAPTGDWVDGMMARLIAGGLSPYTAKELGLVLRKVVRVEELSEAQKREVVDVFQKLLELYPGSLDVVKGVNGIVFSLNNVLLTGTNRLADIRLDRRGRQAPIFEVNTQLLLNPKLNTQARAVLLWLILNHEETHLKATFFLKKYPELLDPRNAGLYDTVQEVFAYVETLKDMKNAKVFGVDYTQEMANIQSLLANATGMPMKEIEKLVSDVQKAAANPKEITTVQDLLKKLMGSIIAAQSMTGGMQAQIKLVGKPLDQVMQYNKASAVALHVPKAFREAWRAVIKEAGLTNIFIVDEQGHINDPNFKNITSVKSLIKQYQEHVVVIMPEDMSQLAFFGDVRKGVMDKLALALLVNPASLKASEISEILHLAQVTALTGVPDYINGAGSVGAGSGTAGFVKYAIFAEAIKQSFLGEAMTARAA